MRSAVAVSTMMCLCLSVSSAQAQSARMTQAQAERACVAPSNSYARRPLPIPGEDGQFVGLLAEYPDDYLVQRFYKRCVWRYSRKRTNKRVNWRL